jgi:cytochrome c biogenesis protein CcdA
LDNLLAILALGLVFGLKHATEVDHIVAVSTIVSEQRSVFRSAFVGALWGAGHTCSLVVVGLVVIVFRIAIPARVAGWLEFAVAIMIVSLGTLALLRALRRGKHTHLHRHSHDGQTHVHVHFHEIGREHSRQRDHSHAITRLGVKPVMVGAMHGLAGSAVLTLLVLAQISSAAVGLLYLATFGVGSTIGMLLMSLMVGLPFMLAGDRFSKLHVALQTITGALGIVFGVWYGYQCLA